MSYFDCETATNDDLPKRNEVVLLILGITAITALVFLAIVEMTRIALQETQRRLIWREEIKAEQNKQN
jgi:hypothetical protein